MAQLVRLPSAAAAAHAHGHLSRTASSNAYPACQLERACSAVCSRVSAGVWREQPCSHMPVLPAKRGSLAKAQATTQEHFVAPASGDAFDAAASRLRSLLSGVGDGESEMVDNVLSEETPESRLQMQVVLGGLVTLVSVAVSMVCGQDPWGGAGFNLATLQAAGVGVLAALPMVAFRAWSWSPAGSKALPAMEDMHMAQLTLQAPWFSRCNRWHVGLMSALEVLPVTLLLLPTMQGGMLAAVNMYTSMMAGGGPTDLPPSPELLQLTCLMVTACVASVGKGLELGVSDQEYEVVQSAVDNADRYYRLVASQEASTYAPTRKSSTGSAAHAALAFRSVAQAWMSARNDASLAAMGLCFADVMALGGLWYATGNLAAPLMATLLFNGVDAWNIHQTILRREARGVVTGGAAGSSAGSKNNNKPPHAGSTM